MEEYTQNCCECGRLFTVQVTTMNVPGGKEIEEVDCPYCHANNGYRMTSGFVYTHKIEDKEH